MPAVVSVVAGGALAGVVDLADALGVVPADGERRSCLRELKHLTFLMHVGVNLRK